MAWRASRALLRDRLNKTVGRLVFFFFQAEDGIRDVAVTGVQTCALPIYRAQSRHLPEQPLQALEAPTQIGWQEPPGLFGEVQQNRARLEHGQRCAASPGIVIDDRRDAVLLGEMARNAGSNCAPVLMFTGTIR